MVLALTFGEIISDAGLVIAIGLIVVFFVLVVLTLIFKLFGKVMGREEEPIDMTAAPAVKPATVAPVVPVAEAVGNTQPVTTTPAVQNGIPAETVAVISAAVAAVAPAGTQYAVSSIRKQ